MRRSEPVKRCGQITTRNGLGCVLPEGHPLPHYLPSTINAAAGVTTSSEPRFPKQPGYEPASEITFTTRTYLAVLFVMACLLVVAFLLLHFNHV